MSEIEVGDIVRRKDNVGEYGNREELEEFEVGKINKYSITEKDRFESHSINSIEFVRKGNKVSKFSNVIRSVLTPKREIINGKVTLKEHPNANIDIYREPTNVILNISSQAFSISNLRELAELANELADVLEGK